MKKKYAKRRDPTYKSWLAMVHRVNLKSNASYAIYGGRGIKVCNRWLVFENFKKDMGVRPAKKTIDRIDNDKGYSVGNCIWSTMKEQQRNRRNNRILEVNGVSRCVSEWAEINDIPYNLIHLRLFRGWSDEDAVNTKKRVYARKRFPKTLQQS